MKEKVDKTLVAVHTHTHTGKLKVCLSWNKIEIKTHVLYSKKFVNAKNYCRVYVFFVLFLIL